LLLLALVAAPVRAAEPDLDRGELDESPSGLPDALPHAFKAVLEKAEVKLGEPFRLTIEIRHDAGERYSLPSGVRLEEFGVREQHTEVTGEAPAVTTIRLLLQAFDVGEREIPAIRLRVDSAAGARQFELPPQKITVQGVIDLGAGEPKMREDTRALPTRYLPVWWPLWALLAVLLGVLGAYAFTRLRRKALAPPPPVPRAPPDVEALERLRTLETEALPAAGRKQEHFFRVSEILRDYLGRRFGFESLELTTDELVASLQRRSTPGLELDVVRTFLNGTDLVKFAKRDPSDGECKAAVEVARGVVERTRPPLAAPEGGRAA
jgi:hypothetical protein